MTEESQICCVKDGGARCTQDAQGAAYPPLNKRLKRTALTKLKLEMDEEAGHTLVCPKHREAFTRLKKEADQKRKKAAAPEEHETVTVCIVPFTGKWCRQIACPGSETDHKTQVDFASLHSSTLKRYKKKFNLATAENASKADVINAIQKHFQTLPINEGKDIIDFLKFMQKQRAPPPPRHDTDTPEPQ
jgi:hypothetical protein